MMLDLCQSLWRRAQDRGGGDLGLFPGGHQYHGRRARHRSRSTSRPGRNYGANRLQLFRHVILPGALPVIFAGLRLALGTALIVIVAIEFVRARKGVGFVTFYYWEVLVTEKMYAGLFVVMGLGVLLTFGLQWLERTHHALAALTAWEIYIAGAASGPLAW